MSNSKRELGWSISSIVLSIIAGGRDGDGYHDDILEYDLEEDAITSVGHMTRAREYHGISVVLAGDYTNWCDGSM